MMKNINTTIKSLVLITALLSNSPLCATEQPVASSATELSKVVTMDSALPVPAAKVETFNFAKPAESFIAEFQQEVKKSIELQIKDGLLSVVQVIRNII